MEQLLNHITTSLFPETEIAISSDVVEGTTIFTLTVPQEEIGRVIGKNGKVINAIKQLLKVRAMKENVYVDIEIKEL